MSGGQDKIMKVFAPDGRIYQIEYAFKAINSFGQTSIAIRGNDSVVVCTQKKVPDKLIVADSISNIFNISESIGASLVGNMNDAKVMLMQIRNIAAQFKFDNQYEIPIPVLAQRIGNELQKYSQRAGIRPFCCMITLVGNDEEFGPQVYKVDPSGAAIGYKALATGAKEQEALTQLERAFKKNDGNWSSQQAIELAIKTLSTVVSSDFRASEIEVGFAAQGQPLFRKMTEREIDGVLNQMADAV